MGIRRPGNEKMVTPRLMGAFSLLFSLLPDNLRSKIKWLLEMADAQKTNLQDLFVLVIINSFVAGIGFFTQVKIANTLGKAEFGLFAYGIVIASYGGVIIRFGLDRTLVRDLIHYPARFDKLAVSSIFLHFFMFFFVAAGLLVWKSHLPVNSGLMWGVILVALGQSMLGLELKGIYDSWARMSRHAIYNLIQRSLYFLAVWYMLIFIPKSLNVFWLGIFLIITVSFYLLMQYSWALKRINFGKSAASLLRDVFSLARNNSLMWGTALAGVCMGEINKVFLIFYRGNASLGGYAAAWQITTVAILILTQVSRVANPGTARITRKAVESRERIQFLLKYSTVMLVIAFPLSFTSIVYPKLIISILYNPEFLTAVNTLRILGVYALVYALEIIASQYIVSIKKEKLYFANVVLGGIISTIFCLILIPSMGDVGAALALLLSQCIATALYWSLILLDLRKHQRG